MDETLDFDEEYNNIIGREAQSQKKSHSKRQPTKSTQRDNRYTNLRNDNENYRARKTVPGNSIYKNITDSGSKTLILFNSICSRIRLREFNSYVKNGKVLKKNPSATAK